MSNIGAMATVRSLRLGAAIAIGCLAAIVVVLIGITVFIPLFDAGEGIFEVRLVNDTSMEVIVQRHCAVEQPPCEWTTYRNIAPGSSAMVATADGNQDQHYRVISQDGTILGCMPLRFRSVQANATVTLSAELVACS